MTLNTDNSLLHNAGVNTLYESDLDDENYQTVESYGIRERRRKLHTEAEQRRRNAIKRGFEGLLELVHPMKGDSLSSSVRMSKSSILHKAISMVERLGKQKHQKLAEVESLEKEVKALRILCLNYEKVVQNNPNNDCRSVEPVPDDVKLEVFRVFCDTMFRSFESYIVFNSFSDLSASVINWIEESCKPEKMAFLMDSVLTNVFNQNTLMSSVSNRKSPFNSLPVYADHTPNVSQNLHESIGIIHPSGESSLLQINPLIDQSSVYSAYSSSNPTSFNVNDNNDNNNNPVVNSEKRIIVTQLKSKFPVISPRDSTNSNQLNPIQCPLPPLLPSSDSITLSVRQPPQSLIDANFQRCSMPSKDIRNCKSNPFYNFNSLVPQNTNSTVVVDDNTEDIIIQDANNTSSHPINSSCNIIMNEVNMSKELSLYNSSHIQQYKQFIDDLL
ncbi:hypothetical protein MN116_007322 [Schistosoma mekongi]|uniref:BHLH domain-containing protein n=1 Tax=Schistosoma mekongi TaxID=38744 RepID=A0AAE2D366_SCHME|nr:hypothetical protein MN116_007322 [Schistosoma mekongi]